MCIRDRDHIGAIPYLLKNVKLPIYGTRLTLGLVENKLKEHQVIGDLRTIKAGDKIQLGDFKVETIRTTHSIADSLCLAIDTPAGVIFHSGDFKIDYTPIDGEPIDFSKLAEIGKKGVTLMLCDSTNAVRPVSYTHLEGGVSAQRRQSGPAYRYIPLSAQHFERSQRKIGRLIYRNSVLPHKMSLLFFYIQPKRRRRNRKVS